MGAAVKPRQAVGDLKERITLQRREGTPDGFGGMDYEYIDTATVRGRVEPVKSDEQFLAGGIQSIDDVLVHIRHRDDVDPVWRLVWRDRQFSITGLRNLDERRQFLTIDATSW